MTRVYFRGGTALALTLSLAACGPAHIQLHSPPEKEASLKERRDYYQHQRPKLVQTKEYRHRPWEPTAFLVLADGTEIHHASDLLSVVDETSPTARAAMKAEDDDAVALVLTTAGWVFTAGGAVGAISFLIDSASRRLADQSAAPSQEEAASSFAFALGSYAAMGVGLALATVAGEFSASSALEKETAFLTYEHSLRARLALTEQDFTAETKPTETLPAAVLPDGQR